ncbi:hypothetical protein LguiA_003097 [Lonicera macranthoides]
MLKNFLNFSSFENYFLYIKSLIIIIIMSMSSSEIVDSGKFSGQKAPARLPEKSNFNQTCSLLSQYLKQKGNLGDLNLGIANGKPETYRKTSPATSTTTMNLFPVSKPDEAQKKKSQQPEKTAPMTIFYGGQVIVFNDFPAEKANELMLLASKGIANNSPNLNFAASKPTESVNLNVSASPNVVQRPPQPIVTDLPIARKASLHRFLEKRKDRITARAPYQYNSSSSSSKIDESKSWLGLGAQSPLQFGNQL